MKLPFLRLVTVLFISSVLAACAAAPKMVQSPKRFFWPPEPDVPKIEWIAEYTSDVDIKQANFMSAIIGNDSLMQLGRPISVASDGEDRMVVSDQETGQVYMFNFSKREVLPLGGSSGAVTFTQPTGVAVDAEGNFYIADTGTRKVYVVNGENVVLRVMDFSAQAKSIGSLAVDRSRGVIVVPDAKGGKLFKYTLKGELQSEIDGKGYFSFPNAVAVASDGSMYVADSFNATIIRLSIDGKFLSSIGKRGDSAGNLTLVTGVAIDSEDHIYATDGRLHNVTIFDVEGNTLLVVGGQHSVRTGNIGRGGFQIPQGISIDKNDRIYVADSMNKRIQVLQYLNQRYLSANPIVPPKP